MDSVVAGTLHVAYQYDAAGQLVRRTRNGSVDRYFLWANEQLVAELDGTASSRIGEYAYYPDLDQPVALLTGSTSVTLTRWFEQDILGNVVGLLDSPSSSDNVVQKLSYSPWGAIESITGTLADTNRLRWKGLLYEGDSTQLYYMRARWYDPAAHRFVSEDPLGVGGGLNLYVFAANDPMNSSDPYGESGDVQDNEKNGCHYDFNADGGWGAWVGCDQNYSTPTTDNGKDSKTHRHLSSKEKGKFGDLCTGSFCDDKVELPRLFLVVPASRWR